MLAICDYLPGSLCIGAGSRADYDALHRFHYLPTRPATFAAIVTARFIPALPDARDGHDPPQARTVGVGVLSWPVAHVRGRNARFHLAHLPMRDKLLIANRDFRTISRIIVHPQFRGIGLATALIRALIDRCPTRYIEAIAQMGRAHPLFERAGMERIALDDHSPLYYILDRATPERAWERSVNT